ncbi:MAG: NADH-quinone oxidoreductase subunit F, partial [Defluviitaleaceae bacterium]|nr:NADH-quinone oxidoreductase subunit F [Defluviitaleaceae bacterium]
MDSVKFIIGKGSCGIAAGADKTEAALRGLFPGAVFSVAGCIGTCYLEPIIDMILNGRRHTFVKADVKCAEEIAKFARGAKNEAEKYFLPDEDKKILQKQKRLVLKNCGLINPEDIDEYIKTDGYEALRACLGKKTPEKIISELKKSGLAGRGGAGFPTWFKWEAARKTESKNKYVICNADEGDPGAFMDRAIIEGDPHAVIEGMAIAAYAIGSKEGFVYVRAEYPLAVKRLVTAIGQARQNNFLGKNIMGTEFSFDIEIKEGAGAFVCGEETALIASVEGERGIPRIKPPYPAERGYL